MLPILVSSMTMPYRALCLTIGVSAFIAAGFLGCQGKRGAAADPVADAKSPAKGETHTVSAGGSLPVPGESISELPSAGGTGGLAIDLCTDLYYLEHGVLPQQTAHLDRYIPFVETLEGFSLVTGSQPDGGQALLAERQVSEANPHSRIYLGDDMTPRGLDGYVPALGVHDNIERYLVMNDVEDSALLATRSHAYFRSLYSPLSNLGETQGVGFRTAPATPSLETAKVAALSQILDAAAYYSAMHSESRRSPSSLEALATEFGGFSASGWLNPYTGERMRNVSLGTPTAGDYTDLSDSNGCLVGLHYLDRDGLVSTRLVGFQGEHQRAYLTPDVATPQELTPY